jgi:hypothetical protein
MSRGRTEMAFLLCGLANVPKMQFSQRLLLRRLDKRVCNSLLSASPACAL